VLQEFLRFLAAGADWDKLDMLKRVPQNEWEPLPLQEYGDYPLLEEPR